MKRMLTKSKTKADILSMLDRISAQHGGAMSIPMLRVDQSDHLKLYTCALTTGFLQAMIYCLPRSLENFEGIQRALVMKKISGIEERLSSGPHGFPNAIVITLICQDSPYITVAPLESRTGDSSGIVLLTIALHRYREHIAACAADEAGYLLAPEQELLGYMIDGHHRTEGAYAAGKLDSPFLTGVYLDLDLRKMAASFAEINCNQEKPSAIHTNAIRNLSGLMSEKGLYKSYTRAEKQKAWDLLDQYGMGAYKKAPIGDLSGGQMQRVFLCRAIIASPRILILDEPTTYVDSNFEKEFYTILEELNKSLSIVMVSHDLGTICSYVKTIACVNRELHYHNSNLISAEQLQSYHCPIELITHGKIPHRVLKEHEKGKQ